MKSLRHYISESQARAESPEPGDIFAFNWREEVLIESRIVDVVQDGFVIEGNDQIMSLLEQCNCQTEDIARYGPASTSRGQGLSLGEQGSVDTDSSPDAGEYDQEGDMAKNELHTIVRAARKLAGLLDNDDNMPEWTQKKITKAADYVDTAADYISSQKERGVMEQSEEFSPVARATLHRIMMRHPGMLAQHGPEKVMAAVDEVADLVKIGPDDEIGTSDPNSWVNMVQEILDSLDQGVAEGSSDKKSTVTTYVTGCDWDKVVEWLEKNVGPATLKSPNWINGSHGKGWALFLNPARSEPGKLAFQVRVNTNLSEEELKSQIEIFCKGVAEGSLNEDLQADDGEHYRSADDFFGQFEADHFDDTQESEDGMEIRGYIDGVNVMVWRFNSPRKTSGYGVYDDSQLSEAEYQGVAEGSLNEDSGLENILANYPREVEHFRQGGELSSDLESALWDYYFNSGDIRNYNADASEYIAQQLADELGLNEAEYQGRKVPLGKPMRGDVAKSKVYVKDPKTGNIKKVNFGDPNMSIKKSNPERRKNFRARHNCDNPGPRTKARYWSCRAW